MRRGDSLTGAGLIVVAAVCFATLGPLSRFAGDAGVESLTLVTWRAWLGAAVVSVFIGIRFFAAGVRPRTLRSVPVRDRWFMLAAAVANTILNFAAFVAFERISIALTLLVFYLYPAGVAVVSTVWFGERLGRAQWLALAVSLIGMALVVAGAGSLGELDALGIGLAFVAALAQVFYVLAARHGFAHVPGSQAAVLTMAGAGCLYLLIGLLAGTPQRSGAAARVERRAVAGRFGRRHRRGNPDAVLHRRDTKARPVAGRDPGHARTSRRRRAGCLAAGRAAGPGPARRRCADPGRRSRAPAAAARDARRP